MRVLLALGGNAMTGPDGSATPAAQVAAVAVGARAAARIVAAGHEVVLTHGNGPQVGNLLVKNELAAHVVPPVPLDWCGAQTQGTIGAILLNALDSALADAGADRPVAALVTRTLVDADDPGFAAPSKPIGRYLPADEARRMMRHGQIWQDRGERGWRRVVASPEPVEVLDAGAARALLDAGYVVVAAGGGGIPVVREPGGPGQRPGYRGVEAVIDKDLTAALLARDLGADVLVIATDVDQVMLDRGRPTQRPLGRVGLAELREHAAAGQFEAGSMGPKVEAAIRFVTAGGTRAAITSLGHLDTVVNGTGDEAIGTIVVPTSSGPTSPAPTSLAPTSPVPTSTSPMPRSVRD
jgi:carbamate kinase